MAKPVPSTPSLPEKAHLTGAFCLLMVGMTFFWNMPPSALGTAINGAGQYVMQPLGLWQGWGIFTNPQPVGAAMRLRKEYADGKVEYETLVGQRTGYSIASSRDVYINLLADGAGTYIDPWLKAACREGTAARPLDRVSMELANMDIPQLGTSPVVDPFKAPLAYLPLRAVSCFSFTL